MARIELKKCPFCGAEVDTVSVKEKDGNLCIKVKRKDRWIPCSERMPEKDGEYLVFTEYEDVFKCTFDSNYESKWGFEQDYRDPDTLGWAGTTWTAVETVTHWMPLPEPPESEAQHEST